MKIGSEKWMRLVVEGGSRMGIVISPQQATQIARHAEILLEWNRKINLTAIVDPVEVAVKHFLDAIAALDYIPLKGVLLDIGTGGGFPGIPLKIMRPRQSMVLIDGVRKKINFVKHVIRQLQLDQIEAIHTRSENLVTHGTYQGPYDVIVCRALADLNSAVRTASTLLAANGRIIVFQGPHTANQNHVILDHYHVTTKEYLLPILGDPRSIVVIEAIQ